MKKINNSKVIIILIIISNLYNKINMTIIIIIIKEDITIKEHNISNIKECHSKDKTIIPSISNLKIITTTIEINSNNISQIY